MKVRNKKRIESWVWEVSLLAAMAALNLLLVVFLMH